MLFNICENINSHEKGSPETTDIQLRRNYIHKNAVVLNYRRKWPFGIMADGIKTLTCLTACCEKNF
jgi:hypothetical protein